MADEKKAVVSLHGGPGFGKTTIAIERSHKLSEDHSILVVLSQLAATTNEDEINRQLCLDVGVNHEEEVLSTSLRAGCERIPTSIVRLLRFPERPLKFLIKFKLT